MVVGALLQTCHCPCAIVLQHLIVHKPETLAILCKAVIAQSHVVTVLAQPLHLIVYLLRDATMFRETVINQKEYSHSS